MKRIKIKEGCNLSCWYWTERHECVQ